MKLPVIKEETKVNVRHKLNELGCVEFVKWVLQDMEKEQPVVWQMLSAVVSAEPNNIHRWGEVAAVCLYYRMMVSQLEADELAELLS